MHQWVLSFPIPFRLLFAAHPELLAPVLQITHRVISAFLIQTSGTQTHRSPERRGHQRFGSSIREVAGHLSDTELYGFSALEGLTEDEKQMMFDGVAGTRLLQLLSGTSLGEFSCRAPAKRSRT